MANYTVLVAFLLGIFLPSNLADLICGPNEANVEAQCTATGGQCLLNPNCGPGSPAFRNSLLETDLEVSQ